MIAIILLHAHSPHLYRPPPHLPPAMTRFASLVAIAAVATVTSDALVPGADAAFFSIYAGGYVDDEFGILPSAPRLRRPLAALAHRVARH